MKKKKAIRGDKTDYPIKDELDYLLERYTPEQIKELMESVTPKFNSKDIKLPIYYGTGGEVPNFKKEGLTWYHWWEDSSEFKSFEDGKE